MKRKKRDKEEKYYSWELIAEMERLEMQCLLYESERMIQMQIQAEEARLEAPACEEEAEEDFGVPPGPSDIPL